MPGLPGIFFRSECAIALTRIEQDRADRFRARTEQRPLGPREVDEDVVRSVALHASGAAPVLRPHGASLLKVRWPVPT
jgi:hypothetical protein